MRNVNTFAMILAVLAVSCGAPQEVDNPQTSAVSWHPQAGNAGPVEGASAELVRYEEGISFQINTEGLIPGNAYTLWLVVINNPAACEATPCPAPDILGLEDARAQVLFAGGSVAGGERGTLAGSIEVGPLPGWLPDRSLEDPYEVEVQLVINDHGPALDGFMPGMVETYRGGCSDDSPFPPFFPASALADGEPGPNTCLLFQMAAFLPR